MLRVEEVGGISVAFKDASAATVERELKRLDPNLELVLERSPTGPYGGYDYWRVVERLGDKLAPFPVLDWRDRTGPRPLTLAIVEQVRRQEKRDEKLIERINASNLRHDEQAALDSDANYEDSVREFERAARNGGHFSGPIHRSRQLQMTRSRMRSQGRAR